MTYIYIFISDDFYRHFEEVLISDKEYSLSELNKEFFAETGLWADSENPRPADERDYTERYLAEDKLRKKWSKELNLEDSMSPASVIFHEWLIRDRGFVRPTRQVFLET